jgi:hypothetical protein
MLSLSATAYRSYQQCEEQLLLPNLEVSLKLFSRSELELKLFSRSELELGPLLVYSLFLLELLLVRPTLHRQYIRQSHNQRQGCAEILGHLFPR